MHTQRQYFKRTNQQAKEEEVGEDKSDEQGHNLAIYSRYSALVHQPPPTTREGGVVGGGGPSNSGRKAYRLVW